MSAAELAKLQGSAMGQQRVYKGDQVRLHEGGSSCSPDHAANSLNDAAIQANKRAAEAERKAKREGDREAAKP